MRAGFLPDTVVRIKGKGKVMDDSMPCLTKEEYIDGGWFYVPSSNERAR
ncbi:MAG: hypothetical protein J1E60_06620 [Christensenellaceae bacterium]|nr:hypothetical protein [Christensenellaceae bacterium]